MGTKKFKYVKFSQQFELCNFLSPVRVEIQVKIHVYNQNTMPKLEDWLGADNGSMQRCGKDWRRRKKGDWIGNRIEIMVHLDY